MSELNNVGLAVRTPGKSCQDPNCPFHGELRVRGRLLTGKAVGISAKNMAVVERESYKYNSKYMRYLKKRSKLHAHLPPCVEIKIGDIVMVAECRPLAKTVSFVVLQKTSSVESSSGAP